MATATFDVSDTVLCDDCDTLFTAQSPETGGMLFGRKALCPTCAPKWEAGAIKHGEQHFIKDRARDGETFFAATMRWRDGNHQVRITGPQDFVDDTLASYQKRTSGGQTGEGQP